MCAKKHTPVTSFGSRTDIGCVRDHNEDSLIVASPLFAVCDGMGGHEAGEVASEIAADTLAELAPTNADSAALGKAVEAANTAIIDAVAEGRGREGMGTTCTAAIIEGERLVIAQVGDSRAYLLSGGKLQQITRDHSLVADLVEAGQMTAEEARTAPNRSIITRALGTAPDTVPDLYELNVKSGDRLLVCSDGLSGMLTDKEIEKVLCEVRDPQDCASQLVDGAIIAGGVDNITVIVADVEGGAEKRTRRVAVKTKVTVGIILVLLAAIIGGAAYGLNYWVSNAAFLGESDGYVAVYRGVNGSLFGIEFNSLDHATNVRVDALNPGVQARIIDRAITTDSVEAADEIIAQYKAELNITDEESTAANTTLAEAISENANTNANENANAQTSNANAAGTPDQASNTTNQGAAQ